MNPDTHLQQLLLSYQRTEVSEHLIYSKLAAIEKSENNRKILLKIADDELRHSRLWRKYTGQDVAPDRVKVWLYFWLSRILGLTFGIKLMERGEDAAQENYEHLIGSVDGVERIAEEEKEHENQLLALLDEERLRYVSSIVLGLNDALVELTGGLAGLTLALRNVRLIALSALVVGLAAAMSMGASEYLSTKTEKGNKEPLKSAIYTGVAYVFTVLALIAPYFLASHPFVCLAVSLAIALLIIAVFNYYVSVAMDRSFKSHFLEMAGVSLGVAAFSFGIGYLLRVFLGVEV